MPCLRKVALLLARLLFNIITGVFKFVFLFFCLVSLYFAKLVTYIFRGEDEYEDELLYEDEEEYDQEGSEEENEEVDEEEEEEIGEVVAGIEEVCRNSYGRANKYLVADIENDGENLIFTTDARKLHETDRTDLGHERSSSYESIYEDPAEYFDDEAEAPFYVEDCATSSDNEHDHCDDLADYEVIKEVCTTSNPADHEIFGQTDDEHNDNNDHERSTACRSQSFEGQSNDVDTTQRYPITIEFKEHGLEMNPEKNEGDVGKGEIEVVRNTEFTRDEKFLIFDPPKSEARKLQRLDTEKFEVFEDTYTIGSTSKSSSEWRSSIPDSGTEDPFSSSSRRSCHKWESYTVYQKYDEEMIYLDRISAQKLHETESLRSFQVEPRSISRRIVHKLANNNHKSTKKDYKKSYRELEAAYVAQVCLAWEALNWNYANFQRKLISREEEHRGCPAYIAQQFQQLQVLLQRFIENEPYERGRRPEIYARIRNAAPKLLHVPEYHDYEGEYEKEGEVEARIESAEFMTILEEAIRTFMSFVKADRKTHCQVVASLFKRRRQSSVDPTILHVLKKHCNKKKLKVKELQRSCILFRKRRIERRDAMEIMMALIDIEVVSRVLRMRDITTQQLKWCEEKMSKVRLLEGKLQRDSSPLFFPAHSPNTNNTLVVGSP
ncbi:hypothetical protein vseg_017313 [Gypsophila vaccaria]